MHVAASTEASDLQLVLHLYSQLVIISTHHCILYREDGFYLSMAD